jgi:hypothetical protein
VSISGGGDAVGVLDRGWEAAGAAVDGEQELRRSSGGASRTGRRKAVEMQVRECKSEFVKSSGTCFRSRRRHERAGTAAGNRRDTWHTRAAAARRGGVGRGPARGGERRRGAGTARGAKRGGAGQLELRHMAGEGGGVGREKTERGRTGGRRRRTLLQFAKSAGTPL